MKFRKKPVVFDNDDRIEDACRVMHDAYEAAATQEGWETQERSRKPWEDVPEANKATMRAAVAALFAAFPLAGPDEVIVKMRPGWKGSTPADWRKEAKILQEQRPDAMAATALCERFADALGAAQARQEPQEDFDGLLDVGTIERAAESNLRIEGTWLVRTTTECTCDPHYGAHQPHCGMEPEVDLSTLPGWVDPEPRMDEPQETWATVVAKTIAQYSIAVFIRFHDGLWRRILIDGRVGTVAHPWDDLIDLRPTTPTERATGIVGGEDQ